MKLKKSILILMLFSGIAISATKWVDVPGQNFSYAIPYTTYEKIGSPKVVGAIMFDIRTPSNNGGWTYSRGFIDCTRMMYTGNQKAIDLKLGETVYASQYEQMSWWEQIHPDHWANNMMRQLCGAKR